MQEEKKKMENNVCVYIPRDVYEELERMAEELDMPIGSLLRKLLEKA